MWEIQEMFKEVSMSEAQGRLVEFGKLEKIRRKSKCGSVRET